MTVGQCTYKLDGNYLSFLHLNAQSLKKNHDDIVTLIHKKGIKMDFIMISETWLEPELEDGYIIPGYELVHAIDKENIRGKGSAIYIKTDIFPFCKILEELSCKREEFQSVFVLVTIPGKPSFITATTYRSPSYPLELFLPYLEDALHNVHQLNKPCFWAGDWNLNLFLYNDKADIKMFLDCLNSFGFFPTITIPTRTANTQPYRKTLIDNIFCNALDTVKQSGTICADIADHEAVFCTTDLVSTCVIRSPQTEAVHRFDYRRIDELKTNVSMKLEGFSTFLTQI